MKKSVFCLVGGAWMWVAAASIAQGTYQTWVLADGSIFEGNVKEAQPGQVVFIQKDGSERTTSVSELSSRSRVLVAEALGLTLPPVAAEPAPSTPQPAAVAMPAEVQPAAGNAVDATSTDQLRALEGEKVVVVGTVTEVPTLGSSGHRLIEFAGAEFSVFIPRDQIERSADWILDDLPGKRLQVTGTMESYRDKPQIRGLEPSQLVRVR